LRGEDTYDIERGREEEEKRLSKFIVAETGRAKNINNKKRKVYQIQEEEETTKTSRRVGSPESDNEVLGKNSRK